MEVGVIGSGSWATAFVKILHENLPRVHWYIRNEQKRHYLMTHGRNLSYLRGVHFQLSHLQLVNNINELIDACQLIYLVVPSAFLGEWLRPISTSLEGKLMVTSIKGIIPEEFITATEYVKKHFGVGYHSIGVVSGPCHAEEVAQERLSYLTVACKEEHNIERVTSTLKNSYIHTVASHDIYGIEYSAILKNIYAVAVGMAHGLGYGDNFLAVLTSNAQMELTRFLQESYSFSRESAASVYLGDLLVTCYSNFSRNRTFGAMIGKGYSVLSAQMEMEMVAEGYYAAQGIHVLNTKHGVHMPIAETIYRVLYEQTNPAVEMQQLAQRLI